MTNLGINIELPNINDRHRNKKYRYVYGVHSPRSNKHLAAEIVKYDLANNRSTHWFEKDMTVGEPIFVANPSASHEDEGVLIVLASHLKRNESKIVVLDARQLKELARADLPQAIPPALHGWFYGKTNERNT